MNLSPKTKSKKPSLAGRLTASQQDYIEIVYRLSGGISSTGVRVTDIAAELGTRLPTVTRTVVKLTAMGILEHVHRQTVFLSRSGHDIAKDIVHRHEDLVSFFTQVLGLPAALAEQDACQIEHGISALTAQRLHEFMEYTGRLDETQRELITRFKEKAPKGTSAFRHLPDRKVSGWRS